MRSTIEPMKRRAVLAQSTRLASAAASACALGAGPAIARAGAKKLMAIDSSRGAASWPLSIARRAGSFECCILDVDLRCAIHPSGVAVSGSEVEP